MPKVTFTIADDQDQVVDAAVGQSLMKAAVNAKVPRIDGECGGEMSCATCHVWVDSAWADRLPARGEEEAELLEFDDDFRDESRLSCQIKVTDDLDGLCLTVPGA